MLLRSLFVLLLFTTLAETIVHGAHALAQVTLQRQSLVAEHDEIAAATTAAQTAIASAVAAGGNPQALAPVAPSPQPACRLTNAQGCVLDGASTISFDLPGSATTASPCPQDACTIYEQGNDAVSEGRVRARIDATISTASGTVVAARSAQVLFRTMLVPPYAAVVGQLDGSFGPLRDTGAGDDGGAVPNGTAPGSLVDVVFRNASTGATMPANVWQSEVQDPGATAHAWSP